MTNLVRVISTQFDQLQRRVIKILRYGKSDVQTSIQASPFGIDSNPIKDMSAIYAQTGQVGKTVIIGYLNVDQLADVGEFRTYATDENGNQVFYTWMKKDGTMELGGNTKNLTRYQELEQGFNQLREDLNTHIQNYNTHLHSGVQTGGGTSAVPTVNSNPSSANITGAKIEQIKTL